MISTETGQQVLPSIPETRNPNPQPETRNPKPETRNLELETRNPKHETRHPKPETRNLNPKPETRNPKPETRNPKRAPQAKLTTEEVNTRVSTLQTSFFSQSNALFRKNMTY